MTSPNPPDVVDLGRLAYAAAYQRQVTELDRVLAAREAGTPVTGTLLLVEHDPVITVSRRASASSHLLASPALLAEHGVAVEGTDRGGDITYHGPGQLVVYPILDLNVLNAGLHDYMRMLESAIIGVCARFGVEAGRDPGATGVWVPERSTAEGARGGKICAMGVRVRRWVSMHGLAINVTTNLKHFGLIVPCGLAGRPVTSLERELGAACPTMAEVKSAVVGALRNEIARRGRCAANRSDAAESV